MNLMGMNPRNQKQNVVHKPESLDENWWQSLLKDEPLVEEHSNHGSEVEASLRERQSAGEEIPINWDLVESIYARDDVIELKAINYNDGGVLVSGDGILGFVPISHLLDFQTGVARNDKRIDLSHYMGRNIKLKIIEYDSTRGRIVLSEGAGSTEPGRRNTIFSHLESTDQITGTVTNITNFGVFVDLGGVEGLIHLSELSWGRVNHPSESVSIGEQLSVYILELDPRAGKVSLSLKRGHPNPWEQVEDNYMIGQIVEVTIKKIVPFGAFVCLEDGLDGLIHISEFPESSGADDQQPCIEKGQVVTVRIIKIDQARKRMALSLLLDKDRSKSEQSDRANDND